MVNYNVIFVLFISHGFEFDYAVISFALPVGMYVDNLILSYTQANKKADELDRRTRDCTVRTRRSLYARYSAHASFFFLKL